MRKLCYLTLTCDDSEKEVIANALLEKHLIVCAKFLPVNAMYWWQGSIANENEVMLFMESADDLFEEIERELKKIHSYDTFVLTKIAINNINEDARKWMEGELKTGEQ